MPPPTEPPSSPRSCCASWPLPEPSGGKEARGSILVIGGSAETLGAVVLAAEAALRAGAGKLQVATAASVAPFAALALPEALVRGAAGDRRRRDPRRRGRGDPGSGRRRGRRPVRAGDDRQGADPGVR